MSATNEIAPKDDPVGVPNGSYVYRRIVPEWWIPDGNGGRRLTSAAFIDLRGYVSIGIGKVLEEQGLGPEAAIADHEGYGLARLEVSWIRDSINLGITKEPTDREPWHGAIWGNKTKSIKSQLRAKAVILIEPELASE